MSTSPDSGPSNAPKASKASSPVERLVVSAEQFVAQATARLLARLRERLAEQPLVHLCLTGGSTPRPIYQALAHETSLEWSRVRFYFGDERSVPPTHADSNFRMASETLLEPLHISPRHIARLRGELAPDAAAAEYESQLRAQFPDNRCAFDLLLLGMGDDGHCASLFPNTPALKESQRWVVSNPVEKLHTTRLTLTFSALNGAREVLFLVNGAKKAPALAQVLTGAFDLEAWPSQGIRPVNGRVCWLLDEAAAEDLPPA